MLPIRYGKATDQVGELFLPEHDPAVLVCLLHGGFWRMPYGRDQLVPMAVDLARSGFAVWNLGYRRVGEGGSSWPATLDDVAAAMAHVPELRASHPRIHPARLLLVGHSAGGHLAFWGAAEARRLGLAPTAAIGLAPVLDLERAAEARLGAGAVSEFLGGSPAVVPDRYRAASPAARLPLGVPQWIVHGTNDDAVPAEASRAYIARARAAGDEVMHVSLPRVDHMALIDPTTPAYRTVRSCLLALV